jgi:hypothetical protein
VLACGVEGVAGEVTAEVDGAAECEDIPVVLGGGAALVVHGGAKTGGGVDTAVTEDGCVVALDAGVVGVGAESAAVKSREVG